MATTNTGQRGGAVNAVLHWLHEQLTLQMLLATYEHGQMKAMSRGEESEMNNAFDQKTHPSRAASTMYYRMDDDGGVLAARPPPLVEVRPQSGMQRHTVEQIIETFVLVQVLDAPVPQMGTQLVEFMQKLDTATPEQVVEVPKLSQDRIIQRSVVCRPQKGRTVGGSADGVVLLFSPAADCRADH